ncbi:MAG: SCO family protein [Acidimicrobiaceae bacterium]|nr:SCO family protein [Acidimicrobiaceae bacterium]
MAQTVESTRTSSSAPRKPGRLTPWIIAALGAVLIAGGISALVHHRSSKSNNGLATFMNVTRLPANHLAPDFTLSDQNGRTVSLDGLRGKAVVLEFMDSHCTDICPIVSQEFVDAHRDLGARASQIAFVAVNVNPWHTTRADVASFTDDQGLNRVPEWHFLTGPPDQLQPIWKAYGIEVVAPNPNVDVQHSDTMYFIDPSGQERMVAEPTDDHMANGTAYLPPAQIVHWGKGIATYAAEFAPH